MGDYSKRRLSMFWKLFLGFTLIPLAELYLLINVGGLIGAAPTIAIVIITGAAGAYLARLQGASTMMQVRQNLENGVMPAEQLLDAMLILVAGVVLLTPGFLTDIAGILLLIPFTRNALKRWLRRKFDDMMKSGQVQFRRFP